MEGILLAYPGAFTYRDLIKLKGRDFELWVRRAQMVLIDKRADAIYIARLALYGKDDYEDEVARLEFQRLYYERD
jgi:hypothetical protein